MSEAACRTIAADMVKAAAEDLHGGEDLVPPGTADSIFSTAESDAADSAGLPNHTGAAR